MPNSHNDRPTGSDAIRDYLDRALPNARVTELPAHADYRPILPATDPFDHGWVWILERRHEPEFCGPLR